MGFSRTFFIAITFFLASLVVQSLGELVVRRHPPDAESATRKLTCISDDDDSALIWNYDYQGNATHMGQNTVEDFKPNKPTPKSVAECAIWDSIRCVAPWGSNSGWDVINSAIRPMSPVFDHRWEGFEEMIANQEPRYVNKVNESSGSAVFSARGNRDFHIYFCANSDPRKGHCFWIIIGGWENGRSSIWSCVDGIPQYEHPTSVRSCSQLGKTEHESGEVLDGYEWRTFRLTWMGDEKTIQVFRNTDTENEPFLEGQVERWDPVSHVLIRSDGATRVRFHFYEYFLTEKKAAQLSTPHFVWYKKNFCVELLIGLCPDCKLQIDLIDRDNRQFFTDTISEDTIFAGNRLLSWRSINLTVNFQKPIPKFVQLKIETILNGDKANGRWAVDSFRVCKSVGSQRRSTIKIHRDRLDPSLWPKVNCQKLSYSKSTVVDLETVNLDTLTPELNGVPPPIRVAREIENSGSFSSTDTKLAPPGAVRNLQVDEADPDTNTINVRWMPPYPRANGVIESYEVELIGEIGSYNKWTIEVSEGMPMCDLWSDYVCFGNLQLPSDSATERFEIVVHARNEDVPETGTSTSLKLNPSMDYHSAPNSPLNLAAVDESAGVIMVKWMHPLSSYTKITRFEITVKFLRTSLENGREPGTRHPIKMNYTIAKRQRNYSEMLYLSPSTRYNVSVVAVNKREKKSLETYTELGVSASLGFAGETKPRITFDGTSIDIEMPIIVNATQNTTVKVIVEGILTCARNQSPKSSHLENLTSSYMQWDAVMYQVKNSTAKSLKIFVNQNNGLTLDCSLHLGENYTIVFEATDWRSKKSFILATSVITLNTLTAPNLAWLAIFPVLAVCVLVLIILCSYRKRIQRKLSRTSPFHKERLSLIATPTNYLQSLYSSNNSMPQVELAVDGLYESPKGHDSCSVSIENFGKYVEHSAANGRLYSQFMLLLRGLTKPCDYGKVPENIPKNRFENLVAYDDTRVVLEKIPGDLYSDYINASYIKGYRKERVYIAAQGPQPNTVNDFWRMVWEQKVRVICMLTNVTEGTKTNCEKYWPDIRTRVRYGNFHVSNVDDQVYADYTFRTLELSYKRNMRKITHLHYTGWPVTGVPTYPGSFVAYLKKLKRTPAGNSPIVVHCSTGVGRTGMIILCDICLRQAAAEKVIDVTAAITRMRDDRANMVSTLQQYLLAHIIIMESIEPWPTQITTTNDVLSTRMKRMRIQLTFDVERLDDTRWQKQALQSLSMPIPSAVENVGNDTRRKKYRSQSYLIDSSS